MFMSHVPCKFGVGTHGVRLAAALLIGLMLGACTVALEPAFNQKIVDEIETLTSEAEGFFAEIGNGIPIAGFDKRSKIYNALVARAATIKLYAEARPAPSGRLPSFFGRLFSAAVPAGISVMPPGGDGDRAVGLDSEGERYANATAGFMDDYLRNLKKLRDRDSTAAKKWQGETASFEAAEAAYASALQEYIRKYQAWLNNRGSRPENIQDRPQVPGHGVSKTQVLLRVEVMRDVLRDALFYERDVLNRNR